MKKMLSSLFSLMAVGLVSCDSGSAAPLPEQAEMLATNTVVAKYQGIQEIPCRFMTALCPDKCDHATKVARFEVLSNERYEHPGKYGDEKLEPGSTAMVDVKKEVLGQSPEIAKRIASLQPGDTVRLTITHYYVTKGQGQFPVRPAEQLDILSTANNYD